MTKRLEQWELIFIRLIHLLAHHPDFGLEKENILNLAKYARLLFYSFGRTDVKYNRYIQFYLQIVANSNNISLLYHLAQRCKTIRDAESHTFSEVRCPFILQSSSVISFSLILSRTYTPSASWRKNALRVLPSNGNGVSRAIQRGSNYRRIFSVLYHPIQLVLP